MATPFRQPAEPQRSQSSAERLGLDAFREPPTDLGLSLDRLSAAMHEMLIGGQDPYAPASDPATGQSEELNVVEADPLEPLASEREVDDGCEVCPRSILEAILFVGDPDSQPVTSTKVAGLMRGVRPAEVDDLVRDLNAQYAAEKRPYHIQSEGAGYRLTLRDEFSGVREKFYGRVRQTRLSPAAVEVLSIVAYQGPVTAEDVNKLRGQASGSLLAQLVRRQILESQRGSDDPRKTVFRTSQRFLDLFALESLAELPRSEDIEKR